MCVWNKMRLLAITVVEMHIFYRASCLPYDKISEDTIKLRLKRLKIFETLDESSRGDAYNLLYAGDVAVFCSTRGRKKPIPTGDMTYLSKGTAIGSDIGVFAARHIPANQVVCLFVGKYYSDDTPVLSNGNYIEELHNGSKIDPLQPDNNLWQGINDVRIKDVDTWLLPHGHYINEPTSGLQHLDDSAILGWRGMVSNVNTGPRVLTLAQRASLRGVELWPNVVIDNATAYKFQGSTSHELHYIQVKTLRPVEPHEELLMCYGSSYQTTRTTLQYTASTGVLADFFYSDKKTSHHAILSPYDTNLPNPLGELEMDEEEDEIDEEEDEIDGDEEDEILRIWNQRLNASGEVEYLVEWVGDGVDLTTWQVEDDLGGKFNERLQEYKSTWVYHYFSGGDGRV